jgi:hypothetical protein
VAVVKGEDICGPEGRAPPRTQDFHSQNAITLVGDRGWRQETTAPFDFFQLTIDHEAALTLTFRLQLSNFSCQASD